MKFSPLKDIISLILTLNVSLDTENDENTSVAYLNPSRKISRLDLIVGFKHRYENIAVKLGNCLIPVTSIYVLLKSTLFMESCSCIILSTVSWSVLSFLVLSSVYRD